ncbi:MAG: 2-hydroxyacyl-CoA dehydratase [Chloroflexi bacterium]|nr:2-hydroxyacyl-CoA dehydratase [Chloroflexota bacterium]
MVQTPTGLNGVSPGSGEMEARLRRLIEANSPENRYAWAREWKAKGGKVAATLCSYVPREVLYAAGFLPWRAAGLWSDEIPLALSYRPSWGSPFNTRILEAVLKGDLDFADAVIGTDWDIDLKRLWDAWSGLRKPRLAHIMFIPRLVSELHYQRMRLSIVRLADAIESELGITLDPERLKNSVRIFEEMRRLVRSMYQLRKRDVPAVSGAESLGITTAALVMPPEEFNCELAALLPYLETRKATPAQISPRIMVSSDFLDDTRYLKLAEEVGAAVVMDDLDTGSRSFLMEVDQASADPLRALAVAYLNKPGCPRMADWERQADQMLDWAREYRIDGILELRLSYSMVRQLRTPTLKAALERAGIPFISMAREYQFANENQLRTRIGAFIELLEARTTVDSTECTGVGDGR